MPLPIDDDFICMTLDKKNKPVFATFDDWRKFMKLLGETILESVDEEENIREGMIALG